MSPSPEVLDRARKRIADRLGLAFPEGRQADLERGFLEACRTSASPDPDAYLGWLATLPKEDPEWARLAGHVTVGETYFFRDRACFHALEPQALPSLLVARRAEGAMRLVLHRHPAG